MTNLTATTSPTRRRGRLLAIGIVLALVAACGGPGDGDVAQDGTAGEPTGDFAKPYALDVGTAVAGAFFIPIYVAEEAGCYDDEGLDVNLLVFDGGGDLMAAMASGSVDVAGGATASLASAVAQGIQAKAVYGLLNTLPYDVVVGEGIEGYDDLRGKNAGVSGAGSLTDTAVRMVLEAEGLQPDADVTILDAGGGDAPRLAALSTGRIAMTVANPGSRPQYEQVGATLLLAAEDFDLPFQGNAVVANTSFMESQPAVLEAFVRGTMCGAAALRDPAQKESVSAAIAKHVGVDDERVVDALYDYASAGDENPAIFPIDGEINVEGVQTILDQRADEPAVAALEIDQLVDTSITESLSDYAEELESETK